MIVKKTKLEIKHRVYNAIMNSGNKTTVENNLLKSSKKLLKTTPKKHSSVFLMALKNSIPALKMNKQKIKKGKRKSYKDVPTFIRNNSIRLNLALKFMVSSSTKRSDSDSFFNKFSKEILDSSNFKSNSVEIKNELQKQVLLQKSVFSRYRWNK